MKIETDGPVALIRLYFHIIFSLVTPLGAECIIFKTNDVDVIFVTRHFTLIIVTGWVFVLSSGAD